MSHQWVKKYFEPPINWPTPVYNFKNNPLDSAKVKIGNALFYDPLLSIDNSISCASCHSPYNAFAHTDHALSHGIYDRIGKRNAPALMNLAWQPTFMWDGAINHLDMQSLAPITHPDEMGSSINEVVLKLNSSPIYKKLFFEAFNDSIISGERVLKSLSQFMLTLISADSKYDQVKNGKANFTTQEQNGYVLFTKYCTACHKEPLFTNHSFQNNGLPLDSSLNDLGRMSFTNNSNDSLKFKVPTLRNIEFTFPYMHDGRFKTLNEVMNHYTNQIIFSKTLAEPLKSNLPLSSNDKVDIIAFLLTLSDKKFLFNKKNGFPKEVFFPKSKEINN
jgi:cytochrome c peroxidase